MTMVGRRERTKAANRAAILDAARTVFAEQGYEGASVRDIIRRTDLASGTFYNYFPDKDAIFVALIEETGAEARRRVRSARLRAQTAPEFVEGGYRAFFEFIVEDPERFAFMRRNLDTMSNRFGSTVLPAGTEELSEDLRSAIEAGQWWWALVILGGGLLTGTYVYRVLAVALTQGNGSVVAAPEPGGQAWIALALALLSVLLGFLPLGALGLVQIGRLDLAIGAAP